MVATLLSSFNQAMQVVPCKSILCSTFVLVVLASRAFVAPQPGNHFLMARRSIELRIIGEFDKSTIRIFALS